MSNIYSDLQTYFGYKSFRGKQEEIIQRVLEKKHTIVIMPTGMGKSLCYQIPALSFSGLTVVISPLIALMQDQVQSLRKKGIEATFINSSLNKEERNKRYKELEEKKYKLLYVTPERFRKEKFLESISKRQIDLLAVDEAHCISQWGHDFRPDYTRIGEIRCLLGNPPVIALTATATPEVQKDMVHYLKLNSNEVKIYHQGIDRTNLHLRIQEVHDDRQKVEYLLSLFQNKTHGNSVVYFSLIKHLKYISTVLHQKKIPHMVYHGGLETDKRKSIQNQFMNGENNIVLATNAFGMGVDKDNIRYVIHMEIPQSIESYYQEIGRAGRDGKQSECILLYNEEDLNIQLEFIKWQNPSEEYFIRAYDFISANLEKVNAYGTDYVRENLSFKNKNDYRLETVLRLFDRYHVTKGNIDTKNLVIVDDIPELLINENRLEEKKQQELKKLLHMVQYTKSEMCGMIYIHNYFGLQLDEPCGRCAYCNY